MAAPVLIPPPQAPLVAPAPQQLQPPPPAPAGVGAAPNQMQPAQPPAQPPDAQAPGFVETAMFAIKDFVLWLFKKIFCCCQKEEPKPPAAPVDPAAPKPQQPHEVHRQILAHLQTTDRGADIVRYFNLYFTTEAEKNQIFHEIGRAAPRSWRHMLGQSYITIGQQMVLEQPKMILSYLLQRVSSLAYPKQGE